MSKIHNRYFYVIGIKSPLKHTDKKCLLKNKVLCKVLISQ